MIAPACQARLDRHPRKLPVLMSQRAGEKGKHEMAAFFGLRGFLESTTTCSRLPRADPLPACPAQSEGSSSLSRAASAAEQVSMRHVDDSDTGEPPQWVLHFAGSWLTTRMNWEFWICGGSGRAKLGSFPLSSTQLHHPVLPPRQFGRE